MYAGEECARSVTGTRGEALGPALRSYLGKSLLQSFDVHPKGHVEMGKIKGVEERKMS